MTLGTKRRRLEAELGQVHFCPPAERFRRRNFPPGGGNHHHHHHQQLSHLGEGNLHQHIQQHHLISNPSSSLVFNLVTGTIDWCLWVTSSVDYILQLITIWFIWLKIICSDPICYLIPLWSWAWLSFVSSYFCSRGHGRNHVASNHVNLICVWYFDSMYVVIPLVVSCECRLHDSSPYLGLRECNGVVIRWWVARVTEA